MQLVPVLRPLVTANNFVAAYPPNNAIIITDYAENVRRLANIIRSIDLPATGDVQVLQLKNASAIDIAQILTRVIPETSASPTTPGQPAKAAIAVDPRTNSLILRGDSPALIARVKALALSLDTPGAGAGNIFVVPLRNAEAGKIAETLRALLAGGDGAGNGGRSSFSSSAVSQPTAPGTSTAGSSTAARADAKRTGRLDNPAVLADQLPHHHRARADLSQPARRDRPARRAPRPGLRRSTRG